MWLIDVDEMMMNNPCLSEESEAKQIVQVNRRYAQNKYAVYVLVYIILEASVRLYLCSSLHWNYRALSNKPNKVFAY